MSNDHAPIARNKPIYFGTRRTKLGLIILFIVAAAVQILVLQNNREQIDSALSIIQQQYSESSTQLVRGEYSLFLFGPDPPSDANVLAHPPGYAIFGAFYHFVFGESAELRIAQILLMSLTPIVVWLIASGLVDPVAAWLAAALTAISPQLSYNALLMLPDGIAALIILIAIYCFVLAYKKESLSAIIFCAFFLGISCWFRANGILAPVFFAGAIFLLFSKKTRFRFAIILLTVFLCMISPITIRNYLGFHSVIPLSLGSGLNLVEGIGDFDKEGRFQMPATDAGVQESESISLACPDCSKTVYGGNGVERERIRKQRAMSVIWSNPVWFGGVVLRRGASFVRFERVPAISDKTELSTGLFYYLNIPLKFFQKAFITAVFLPLLIGGVFLIIRAPSDRSKLVILLLIPLYYICIHSWIHTEYRYILAMQPFFLLISSVALSWVIRSLIKTAHDAGFAGSK